MSSEDEESSCSDSIESGVDHVLKQALRMAAYKAFNEVFSSVETTGEENSYEWKNSYSDVFDEVQGQVDQLMNGFTVPDWICFDALCSVGPDFVAPPHASLYSIPCQRKTSPLASHEEEVESFLMTTTLSPWDNLNTAFKEFEIYLRFLMVLHARRFPAVKKPKVYQAVKCFLIASETNIESTVAEFLKNYGPDYPVVNKLWKAGRIYGMFIVPDYETKLKEEIKFLENVILQMPDSKYDKLQEYEHERSLLVAELEKRRLRKPGEPVKRRKRVHLTLRDLFLALEEFKTQVQEKFDLLEVKEKNAARSQAKNACSHCFDPFRVLFCIIVFVAIIFR
jgi:hypothetical protein